MVAHRLTLADVIETAFVVLDDAGLDAVTLREISRRLGVHLNSVSFQVKSKSRLLELMADAMLGTIDLEGLPDAARPRIEAILRRYRGALLSRRDGARLVAGTSAVERNTLYVGDAIVDVLTRSGADEETIVRAFWGLHYFLIGLVQEEQAHSGHSGEEFAVRAGDYPALHRVGALLIEDPFEQRFEFGIGALLDRVFGA